MSPVNSPMGVGATIDLRASDPELIEKTPILGTRLGNSEMELLVQTAKRLGTTKSNLARRLLVQSLLQLQEEASLAVQ